MASEYAYITVANLETFMGEINLETVYGYIDATVEVQISQAEKYVNDIKKQTYSGTIPDDVVAATKLMAKRLLNNLMIEDGMGGEGEQPVEVVDDLILMLLADTSKKYDYKLITNVTSRFFE